MAYAAAIGGIVAVAALRWTLGELNLFSHVPYLLFALPILIGAWLGGWGPGIAATLLGMAAVVVLQIPRDEWASVPTLVGMVMFGVQGAVITYLGAARLKVIDFLSRAARELDERVRHRTHELWLVNQRLEAEAIERERRAEEARQMAVKLEASNRELQDFASVASHDLQEPLRKIQAFGTRLSSRYGASLGPDGQDYIQRMQKASARMQTLINDLLVLSRVATKAQPFTEVDLKDIVGEVLSDLEARIADTGARVCVGALPRIEADPTQMRQLLQNLLANALKFRRKDVPPQIEIAGWLGGPLGEEDPAGRGTATITITDNGIGFDEKYLEKIFTVFQRLHGRGEFEGTGIGLAVCRRIVERHGGTVTARSRPGEGSTFIVQLPVTQPDGPSDSPDGEAAVVNLGEGAADAATTDAAHGEAPEDLQGATHAASA